MSREPVRATDPFPGVRTGNNGAEETHHVWWRCVVAADYGKYLHSPNRDHDDGARFCGPVQLVSLLFTIFILVSSGGSQHEFPGLSCSILCVLVRRDRPSSRLARVNMHTGPPSSCRLAFSGFLSPPPDLCPVRETHVQPPFPHVCVTLRKSAHRSSSNTTRRKCFRQSLARCK